VKRLFFVLLVIATTNLWADSIKPKITGDGVTNYYAVICGVSTYKEVRPNLHYCDNDAQDLRNALLKSSNWTSSNITVLVNSAATYSAIYNAILDMADKSDDDDVCLFFFSGHGTKDPYHEYICPYDSYSDSYDNDIRDDDFGNWIAMLPTNKYLILLDTCFSGGLIRSKALNEEPNVWIKGINKISSSSNIGATNVIKNGDGFVAHLFPKIGAKDLSDNGRGVVITACKDTEYSWETGDLQNGLFTYYLVEGLNVLADSDRNNKISAQECFNYLAPRVEAYVTNNSLSDPQTPQIYDAYGELDFLILNPVISKCTVTAGANDYNDSISFSGKMNPLLEDFINTYTIFATINSADMAPQTLTFPVDQGITFKNNNYSYRGSENGIKESFSYNSKTNKFSLTASKLDLTGLGCTFTVNISVAGYSGQIDVNEAIVNGKRPIPIVLKMNVINSMRVDKLTLKRGTTIPNSDVLTVKGGFSCASVADSNFAANDFLIYLDSQQFTIPASHFTADKKGERFKCTNYKIYDGPDLTAAIWADFNFKTGAFSLTIKNTDFTSGTGTANLDLESGSFSANADVVLP
jgi:hypothetical protein